jgi:oxazoline/thiazoline dehydrogenase
MWSDYRLHLRQGVAMHDDGNDGLIVNPDRTAIRCHAVQPDQRWLVVALSNQGGTQDDLIAQVVADCPDADEPRLLRLLERLAAKGFLTFTLTAGTVPLATLEPVAPGFDLPPQEETTAAFRLSRFAWLRREGDATLLECSLGHARVSLLDSRMAAWAGLLSQPQTIETLSAAVPGIPLQTAAGFIWLLRRMRAVFPCSADGSIAEDNDPVLRHWDYHDLLFHTRSRYRDGNAAFGTKPRFFDTPPRASAVRPAGEGKRISLTPPPARHVGFFDVLENRRSIREKGEKELEIDRLGEFLWHVARVKSHVQASPDHPQDYEKTYRPCAGGGAMHEIELYLIVHRCRGLQPGMYRYAPLDHELEFVGDPLPTQLALLGEASSAAGMREAPDVLIVLASRFNRVAWKYQGMAYALTLKNVGVLLQQMYLVATALGLAPCALGSGNSDKFARAAGLDAFEESSVGEFMLSSKPGERS